MPLIRILPCAVRSMRLLYARASTAGRIRERRKPHTNRRSRNQRMSVATWPVASCTRFGMAAPMGLNLRSAYFAMREATADALREQCANFILLAAIRPAILNGQIDLHADSGYLKQVLRNRVALVFTKPGEEVR